MKGAYCDERGRAEAQEGSHDDLVMALAIALRIVEQVTYFKNTINTVERNFFGHYEQSEKGERITII